MTTYMAIVKGEKAKSLQKRRWVLQIDQTLDTPIKMSSENSPKAVEKLVLQPQKKAKDRRDVSLLLTSLVPRRRLLLFSSSSSLVPESRYLLASCVPYRAVHHAAAAQFIFAFPTKKQLCVSVRRSRVQIPLVPLAFLDDNFRRWFSYGIFQNWRVFFFGSMSLCCKMLVILPFLCFLSKLFFSKSKSL